MPSARIDTPGVHVFVPRGSVGTPGARPPLLYVDGFAGGGCVQGVAVRAASVTNASVSTRFQVLTDTARSGLLGGQIRRDDHHRREDHGNEDSRYRPAHDRLLS